MDKTPLYKEKIMGKLKYILLFTLLGCGYNGDQKVTQDGESFTHIVIEAKYILDIKDICTDANLRSDYESDELYDQAIAQCTLDNLNIFNIDLGTIEDIEEKCQDESLTGEQYEQIAEACELLEGV